MKTCHLVIYPFVLILVCLLDAQLSFWTNFIVEPVTVMFQLCWIVILYMIPRLNIIYHFGIMFLLGIFYDSYYLSQQGIMVFLFPLAALFLYHMKSLIQTKFTYCLLIYFILLFFINLSAFVLGKMIGLTSDSILYFISFSLAPSLLLNTLILTLGHFIIKRYLS